eukprot:UN08751
MVYVVLLLCKIQEHVHFFSSRINLLVLLRPLDFSLNTHCEYFFRYATISVNILLIEKKLLNFNKSNLDLPLEIQ